MGSRLFPLIVLLHQIILDLAAYLQRTINAKLSIIFMTLITLMRYEVDQFIKICIYFIYVVFRLKLYTKLS